MWPPALPSPGVEGYRAELPEGRLDAVFGPDHALELTTNLVGPSRAENLGAVFNSGHGRGEVGHHSKRHGIGRAVMPGQLPYFT